MKIAICASMSAIPKMMEIKRILEKNHQLIFPKNTEKYADGTLPAEKGKESAEHKIEGDLIRRYFKKIESVDAVLVVNEDKNGIKNYIGGNTFLEMSFAHVLNKKVFLLNSVPDMSYTDEIVAMQPIVIDGDLKRLK